MKPIKLLGLAAIMLICAQMSYASPARLVAGLYQQQTPPPPPPPPKPHKLHKPPFHKHLKWRRHHKNLHLPPPPPQPPGHP